MNLPANCNEEQRYNFEERAGIHEYDGHATRTDAERMAYRDVFGIEPPIDSKQTELI